MESDRLRIRRMELEDAPFILKLLNESAFLEHIGDKGVRTNKDAEKYITDGPAASHIEHGFGLDVIEFKFDLTLVGICGLLRREYLSDPDLGYAVLADHQRKGVAFEACNMILETARLNHIRKVLAIVSPRNNASVRLLEKIGFSGRTEIDIPGSTNPDDLYFKMLTPTDT